MKTRITRALAIALSVLMLVSVLPLFGMAAEYAVGDIITLGSYPQTEVTDSATLSALNGQTLSWTISCEIQFQQNHSAYSSPSLYKYADVNYAGNKYRAVQCMPDSIMYLDDQSIHWFKYEPLQWRVLDPTTGLVLCKYGIDAQPYSDSDYMDTDALFGECLNSAGAYANDYCTSYIRKWLNDDFYNTAFTSSEKAGIYERTLDNSAALGFPMYNSANTSDKVFLLSYKEVTNPSYGFDSHTDISDPARKIRSTNYSQYLAAIPYGSVDYTLSGEESSTWWLRSPGFYYDKACFVEAGEINNAGFVTLSEYAVCPAITVDLGHGAPEEDTGFLAKIKAFFQRIIDWFKSLIYG